MTSMNDFITQYEKILKLIKNEGFKEEAIIFKGFCSEETHNLNILVEDLHPANSKPRSRLTRLTALRETLTELLNCKIVVSTPNSMNKYHFNKLNDINSVKLLDAKTTIPQLEQVFGKDWEFNLPNTSDASSGRSYEERSISFFNLDEEKKTEILPSLKPFSHELASTSPEKREATLKLLAEDLKALGYEIEIKNINPAQQPKIINAL